MSTANPTGRSLSACNGNWPAESRRSCGSGRPSCWLPTPTDSPADWPHRTCGSSSSGDGRWRSGIPACFVAWMEIERRKMWAAGYGGSSPTETRAAAAFLRSLARTNSRTSFVPKSVLGSSEEAHVSFRAPTPWNRSSILAASCIQRRTSKPEGASSPVRSPVESASIEVRGASASNTPTSRSQASARSRAPDRSPPRPPAIEQSGHGPTVHRASGEYSTAAACPLPRSVW